MFSFKSVGPWIFLAFVILANIAFWRYFLKKKNKGLLSELDLFACCFITTPITYFIAAISIITLHINLYLEESFSTAKWNRVPSERYKFSRSIIQSSLLKGKTNEEVLMQLGKASSITDFYIIYELGKPPILFDDCNESRLLIVRLRKTKVDSVYEENCDDIY